MILTRITKIAPMRRGMLEMGSPAQGSAEGSSAMLERVESGGRSTERDPLRLSSGWSTGTKEGAGGTMEALLLNGGRVV